MSATAAKASLEATVEVVNAESVIKRPRDRDLVFGAAERLLVQELIGRRIAGCFKLFPLQATKGSSARKGVHVSLIDGQRIRLSIQPGKNDTAWVYWMEQAPRAAIDHVFKALSSKPTPVPEEVKKTPATELPETQAESIEVMVPEAPPKLTAQEMLSDLALLAVALRPVFATPQDSALLEDVIDTLGDEIPCEQELARQVVQGLINRSHLKECPNSGRIMLRSDRFREVFVGFGIHVKEAPRAPSASVPPSPSPQPAPRKGAVIAAVRATLARRPDPKPPANDVTVQKPSGLGTNIEELERMASAYQEAQASIRKDTPARATLMSRREALEEQVREIDRRLREMDDARERFFHIVLDDRYSSAANRLQQIRSILGA